ncbi:unnamed protein product [Caenorhabditis nigoni]
MKFPFLLLLLIPQSLGIKKMIQIFGKVSYGPFPVTYPSPENCASDCFNLYYCILSWQTPNGSCYHYSYLNRPDTIKVVETDKTEGSTVAFKTVITGNNCPSSYTDMDFKMTISNGDIYSWIKTGKSWNLNGCRDGWKRFNRADGISVCMKTFYSSEGIYRVVASDYCVVIGTDLIGVASVEESRWIHAQMMQYNPSPKSSYAFWINGEFKSYDCPSFCENVDWQDGYTTGTAALNTSTNLKCECGSSCLTVAYIPGNTTKTMRSVGCHLSFAGYVCGYDLKKSV